MLILALDTSSRLTSVCVMDDGQIRSEISARASRPQEADHMRVIETALDRAGVTLREIDAFAGTEGPGSFTGLRVGLSILKGFTADGRRPLYLISTLKALAHSTATAEAVLPCIDAKKYEVYAAAFLQGRTVVAEGAYAPAAFASLVDEALGNERQLWLGDGARLYHEVFEGPNRTLAPATFDFVRPAALASLGFEAWRSGAPAAADVAVPVYHRLSEAEKNKGSQKKAGTAKSR